MQETLINGKWTIKLPEHRANRPLWNHWEYERLHAMYCAIRPGDILIDVGAEEGDLTALYSSWRARPIIIEPSLKMWPWIKMTLEANNIQPLGEYVAFAGNTNSGAPLVMTTELDTEPGFKHLDEGGAPIIRLDDITDRCDVITIDTEGSEYEIILGAERLLREVKPIVFISVHPEFSYDRYKHSADDLLVLMEKWGYTATYLGYDHEKHFMFRAKP